MNSLNLSSFGGLSLLRAEEHLLALGSQLASCVKDTRAKYLVHHSIEEWFLTRIFQVCLRYEDANDCDRNKKEPMMQLALEHEGFDKDLCDSIGESVPKRCKVLLMYNNNRLSLQQNFNSVQI